MIKESDIKEFQENGAVILRNILSQESLETLERGIEYNLKHPSERAIQTEKSKTAGHFIEDFCNWNSNEDYEKFIHQSKLGEVASQLTKSKNIRIYHDHMLTKEPGTRMPTPWHQDQPYYNITGNQNVSFWIPIDPVDEQWTLNFIKGSHKGPWYLPRTFENKEAKWFQEGELPEVPPFFSPDQILGWSVNPGDVVAFHMATLHAAPGSVGNSRRRVFSLRLIGDDIRFVKRPWVTSPPFTGLDKILNTGDELKTDLFPLLTK